MLDNQFSCLIFIYCSTGTEMWGDNEDDVSKGKEAEREYRSTEINPKFQFQGQQEFSTYKLIAIRFCCVCYSSLFGD